MGSKYPLLPPNDIIKVLTGLGFQKVSQKGSHAKYVKQGNPIRTTIIPMHREVARGTLKSILEQADLTLDVFLEKLYRNNSTQSR
ncbi:type II toxin-antitoxin system HicA family toxin [Syntrophomonas wolfei]|jgi:predicted RNA binding protein YcfA (HicA-like mRNA interferase family)|uniref:Type II toxin-antitoxin system HicA family toxin n=1 Tax=Syntrophomonas wolfei TaxID=863 RepID=A0A354Z1Z2_9FIRM|nr:type II toxin-antitoxin system HicA family toxin [Syntrophomonas wolfei]HBK54482.1 type II toxin-antitoxin system HicA family toxin [Syntrophomonas wolfei]